jgi:hypothetical protein
LGSISASIVKKSKSGYLDFGFFYSEWKLVAITDGESWVFREKCVQIGAGNAICKNVLKPFVLF